MTSDTENEETICHFCKEVDPNGLHFNKDPQVWVCEVCYGALSEIVSCQMPSIFEEIAQNLDKQLLAEALRRKKIEAKQT